MRKKTEKPSQIAVEVLQQDVREVYEQNLHTYGTLSLEDRALPDYRDGLLKVHRRSVWAMVKIAPDTGPMVKSARVVGETLGKYHPHGDMAAYEAMQTLVWNVHPCISGMGNWGGQFDSPAAMRYTNARLSEYAANVMVNKDYLPTVDLHPNYDGKDLEPELLPALLPNLLLNGSYGVAVGLNTAVPAFKLEGILKLLKGMLAGKKLTTKACLANLELAFPFGGEAPKDWQQDVYTSLIEEGRGTVYAHCDYVIDRKERKLTITGIPPKLDPDKLMDSLRETEYFTSVQDCLGRASTTPSDIQCVFKRTVNIDDAESQLHEDAVIYSKVPYRIAVVERKWNAETQSISSSIHQWGVRQLLEKWLEWRLQLEARMLAGKLDALNATQQKKNLLLLAQENRALIAQSWNVDDQKGYLSAKLKISLEDAATICALRVSQLGKLDRDKLNEEIEQLKKDARRIKYLQKNLEESVSLALDSITA